MPVPASQSVSAMRLYMGIDGGGTGLRVVLVAADLHVHGQSQGPAANPSIVGHTAASAILADAMRACLGNMPPEDVGVVGIGVAGAAKSHSAAWLVEVVHAVLPQTLVVPSADYEIALVGALGRRMGLLVLAGTGALAYGVNESGESALAGGWGYQLGDEGGGYWLGIEGLRAIARAADGRGPETTLREALLPALGLSVAQELIPWLYRGSSPRTTQVAGLASLVLDAARDGDRCAGEIVARAADELSLAARAVMRRLALSDPPIAFAGGLLSRANPLSDALCLRLDLDALPQALYPPVMGAVLLARDAGCVTHLASRRQCRRHRPISNGEPTCQSHSQPPRPATHVRPTSIATRRWTFCGCSMPRMPWWQAWCARRCRSWRWPSMQSSQGCALVGA